MKKILFFVESLSVGGAEKSLLSLLNNFDYQGYDVRLMMVKRGGDFEQFVPSNLKIESINVQLSFFSKLKFKIARYLNSNNKIHSAQLFWKAAQHDIPYLDEHFDIAISWGQGFATYFVAERVKASKKFAWINTDYDKAGYIWERDKSKYDKFNNIVGISEFVKNSIQKHEPSDKVIVISNIIDRDEINIKANNGENLPYKQNQISVLTVGRLAKYKGFELAIEAIKILKTKHPNIHLYIIGEGIERGFLENLINENNLQDNITMLGLIDNPYPYMKNCDIYLQTSRFEGLGRTIIEAGILNKPIVCIDFPTAFSILENKKTGIIVPMNPTDIADAIQNLIENPSEAKKLSENLSKAQDNSKQKTLNDIKQLFES